MKSLRNLPLVLASSSVCSPGRRSFRRHWLVPAVLIALPWAVAASPGLPSPPAQTPGPQSAPTQPATPQPAPAAQPQETPAATAPASAATPDAAPAQSPANSPAPASVGLPTTEPATANTPASSAAPEQSLPGEIREEEIKQLLVGKQLILRGSYLGDSLSFNEHGEPVGHPPVGSYTLSAVEIEKVHLTKRKLELTGARYGLHFLGALPYEDPSKTVDRVKMTPKKKVFKITIDREQVVKPKKVKEEKEPKDKGRGKKPVKDSKTAGESPKELVASSETDVATPAATADAAKSESAPATSATAAASTEQSASAAAAPTPASGETPAAAPAATQTAAEVEAEKADQPADAASVTTTTSPAHAAQVLRAALDRIFAQGLDDKVMAEMPQFWQLYYEAQSKGVDYRPKDPNVLRSSAVDQQAKVITSIAPDSNEFAQASGIAGRALYRVVIGADGKPAEIAVMRPIGFGLDENAVSAIRKASFQPAIKDGKPVAETLDLAVLFRIYSKRTSVAATEVKAAEPVKPGPYTIRAQQTQQP